MLSRDFSPETAIVNFEHLHILVNCNASRQINVLRQFRLRDLDPDPDWPLLRCILSHKSDESVCHVRDT
jgi:hypothetical protein